MANDVPSWTDDGTLNFAPTRELAFAPQAVAVPVGPWSPAPVVEHQPAEDIHTEPKRWPLWPWRLAIGLAQGLGFLLLLCSRTAGLLPGGDPFLFDTIALPLLLVPFLLLDGLGTIALRRLLPFTIGVTAILAALGWYHRWRILGASESHAGAALIVLAAAWLFIAQNFLAAREREGGWRPDYAALFDAGWTQAGRLTVWLVFAATAVILMHSPWAPRLCLEESGIAAMPFLGLTGALAFQLTAALPRFTDALKNGLVGAATVTLPLACAAALFLISIALGNGPAPLIVLILLMTTLVVAISASHRAGAGSGPRKAWRDGTECFGAILLLVLSGLALWALDARVGALGWTTPRLFAGVTIFFLAAYGTGYSIAALIGLRHGRWMQQLETTNLTLGLALLLALPALASPLADPMRLAAASQVARLANGDVTPTAFDFANLARDSARFGAAALAGLGHSPFPDIARDAAQSQPAAGPGPNPTSIGANIAVRTPGATLPAGLLAKDWRGEPGAPPCLTTASQKCEAYFLDLDSDGTREILLVTGSETRWWGAVMRTDAANHWTLAGHLAAPACGPTLSDLRAGRFKVVPPAKGWQDLSVGGARLAVVPTDSGCSHY